MRNSLDSVYSLAVPLPIPTAAHQIAERFAAEQSSMAKADQVRSNTLAVWVVNDYCQMLGIPTDLENSDSWNPTVRYMDNVADLVLPGIGRLECRPIAAEATVCSVPPETWTLRMGYGVVELSTDLQTARLLGFTPAVADETLALTALSTPEALIEHIDRLRQAQSATVTTAPVATLSQWFDTVVASGWVDAGWQVVDDLLQSITFTPAYDSLRSSALRQWSLTPETGIRRGKVIDLSVRLGLHQVLLLIRLQSQGVDKIHITAQVHPVETPYLPPGLRLKVLDSLGEVFMQAQARQADNYNQLQFSGTPGEAFTVQVRFDDVYHSEQFVV